MDGNLTEQEFFNLAQTLVDEAKKAGVFKPKNFFIFQDKDGNWRGGTYTKDKFINVRDVGPETVLQLLLTHNGN